MGDLNHPTGGSSASGAGKLLGSSPVAALLGTESPAAMMFNLSSGGIEGGVSMGFSMSGISGLGLGKTSTAGRPDDEERRRRLIEILRVLGTRYPRISLEGIESLGKRYGLDTVMEPPDRFKDVGECVVAGSNGSFMVTVCGIFRSKDGTIINKQQIPYTESKEIASSTFTFSDKASDSVRKHEATARKAIMKTLSLAPGKSYITSNLDKFAKNLERLGRMDKLCGTGFSCFEAIAGVYSSLERLYEHEKKVAKTMLDAAKGDIEIRAQREVMCKKSGRPIMNPRKTVGFCLDYWMDHRKVLKRKRTTIAQSSKGKDAEAMEIDGQDDADDVVPDAFYSLIIECDDNASPEMYQSARISSAWVSDQVEKQSEDPNDLFAPTIDWMDPPPTYLHEPTSAPTDGSLQLDNAHMGKLPNVRFVAKLDPPLVLPQAVAVDLLSAVNGSLPETEATRTYTSLLLDADVAEDYNAILLGQSKQVHSETTVVVPITKGANSQYQDHKHINTLFINKPEYGRILEEIPFEHPKQLVQMLPTLRQYAFLNHSLRSTFKVKKPTRDTPAQSSHINIVGVRKADIELYSATSPRFSVSFSDLKLHPSSNGWSPPTPESLTLDDILRQPSSGEDTEMTDANTVDTPDVLSAVVEILPNAEIQVSDHNLVQLGRSARSEILDSNAEPDPQEQEYRKVCGWLARALDGLGGELGCWTEAVEIKAKTLVGLS